MRKISIFNKELTFYNDELLKACQLAIELGYKVHTFNPSGKYISQVFIDNGTTFGSVSEYYSGVSYSTCHISKNGSGNGSGFGITSDPMNATKEGVNSVFISYPDWCRNVGGIEKQTWKEYLGRETILTYGEIKPEQLT